MDKVDLIQLHATPCASIAANNVVLTGLLGMVSRAFSQQSLSRQFIIASFPIFLIATLLIGNWVATKIESGIAHRLGGVTGLYVENFVAPHLQSAVNGRPLSAEDITALQSLLTGTSLSKKVVSFKAWDLKGTILYSQNPELIGKSLPIEEPLKEAYAGNISSEVSDLSHQEHENETQAWDRLIETYVPIREAGGERIIAVAEFYQTTDELSRESQTAQLQSWAVVATSFLAIHLTLLGLVSRGSKTINQQRRELEHQIGLLTELNEQNQALHEKIQRAAGRTTALNENFLRRISSDLHDGPGQDLGFALMQIKTIDDNCASCPGKQYSQGFAPCGFQAIHRSLTSALEELRAISAGLCLPNIVQLPVNEVVERAVRDYESKCKVAVRLEVPQTTEHVDQDADQDAPLPVKITLYRVLQESLANGFRHAGGVRQAVCLTQDSDQIEVSISDGGKGFIPSQIVDDKHLGLKGMRERVEILGGSFYIDSSDQGTLVRVMLPLTVPWVDDD